MSQTANAKRAEYTVTRKLADGTFKEYTYSRGKAPPPITDTIGGLLTAYRSSPEWTSLKPLTRSNYSTYIGILETDRGFLASPLVDLRKRSVLSIRDKVATQRGPAAANMFMRVTSTILTWAVGREWIEVNPLAGVKSLAGGHLRAWTEDEYRLAEKTLPEHLRRAIVLARHTGQRRGDLIAMRWGAYNGRTIVVNQEKGKKGRERDPLTIPAAIALRKELDRWRKEAKDGDLILTTDRGRPWCPTYLSRLIGNAMADIDVKLDGLNVHGLRKLAAASLAEAGCSSKEIASITGHRTLSMVELYTASAQQKTLAESAVRRVEGAAKQAAKRLRNAAQPIVKPTTSRSLLEGKKTDRQRQSNVQRRRARGHDMQQKIGVFEPPEDRQIQPDTRR
jgi:integrase